MSVGVFCTLFLISSCTKSFVTVNDRACLIDTYLEENLDDINTSASEAGYIVPSDEYWGYIDDKVDAAYVYAFDNPETQDYVPYEYIESNINYHDDTIAEEDKANFVDDKTVQSVIRYAGYNSDGEAELWANLDKWTLEAKSDEAMSDGTPTDAYITYLKDNVDDNTGSILTGLTPESGYYGINKDTYVQGKTWSQAFSDFGFIEGLLVYPIGWLLYTFTISFGVDGGGQILAIFLVTLICRSIIVVASLQSSQNQLKMTESQADLQKIQSKYPNSKTNKYEQQKLAAEQQALYKKRGIHPFRQIGILVIQFPIFISVWGALQGSAILTQGKVFGLQLSTIMSTALTALDFGEGGETTFALVIFVLMAIAQFFATRLPTWTQNWRKARIVGNKTVKVEEDTSQTKMMKYLPWIMMVFIIFMGLSLPAAMAIYWFFGALITILQTVLTETVNSSKKGSIKHKDDKNNGKNKKYSKYTKVNNSKKHMKLR